MKLLMYRPKNYEPGVCIQGNIEAIIPEQQIEIFETVSDLRSGLRHPGENTEIGVLVFSALQEMDELLNMKVLLKKLHLILVLPECDEDTVKLAHKFQPRYITYADSDVSQVQGVLQRLAK